MGLRKRLSWGASGVGAFGVKNLAESAFCGDDVVDVPVFDFAIEFLAGLVLFFEVEDIKRCEQGVHFGAGVV